MTMCRIVSVAAILVISFRLHAQALPAPPPREVVVASHGGLVPTEAIRRFGDVALWHPGGISGSALSDDGKLLATAARRSIVVWDVTTGMPIHRFDTGTQLHYSTQMLVFSADGKRLAACAGSAQVFLWDMASGKEIKRFEHGDRNNPFEAVAFNADGSKLIVARWNSIEVHDTSTWKVSSLVGRAKLLSRSTDTLIGMVSAGRVVFSSLASGKVIAELDTRTEMDGLANGLALSADGKSLAVYRAHGQIELWSVPEAKQFRVLKVATPDGYHSVAWSRDGKAVFLGTTTGVFRWDVATGRELPKWERRFDSNFGRLTGLHVLSDNDTLIAAAEDGLVRFFSQKDAKELPRPAGYAGRTVVATTRDGSRIAIGDQEGRVDVWNVNDGVRQATLSEKGDVIRALAFAPDGKSIAIGRSSGDLHLIEVATGKVQHRFQVPVSESQYNTIREVFFDSTGQMIFARNSSGKLVSWNIEGEKPGWGRTHELSSAFTADGKTLVTAATGPVLLYTNPATGDELHYVRIKGEARRFDGIPAMAFSPDGRWLVLATHDRMLRFCDPRTAVEKARVEAVAPNSDPVLSSLNRDGGANSITFSSDGRWLVTGGSDAVVRVWEVATRKEVRRFAGHDKRITFVAFGPGGRSVLSNSEDGAVYQWDLRPFNVTKPADLWAGLASESPEAAYQAIWALAGEPEQAVALLRARISPVPLTSPERIAELVGQLGAGRFAVREAAMKSLMQLGRGAEGALRAADKMDISAEAKERVRKLLVALDDELAGDNLPRSRAIRALALANTPVTRELLREYAEGAPGAFLTEEAKAAQVDTKK